jgi:hypothetical protein
VRLMSFAFLADLHFFHDLSSRVMCTPAFHPCFERE